MAVDVCSEVSSLVVSPRISFSHDLRESDSAECRHSIVRSDALLLESIDFNFCISNQSFSQEVLSTADELFANGKILPAEVKKKSTIPKPKKEAPFDQNLRSKPISSHLRREISPKAEKTEVSQNSNTKKKSLKEFLSLNLESDTEEEEQEKKPSAASATKTFWQFRRSSSLNFDSCRSNTLIRSLHFLSRSNSTGSAPNPKSSSSSSSASVRSKVMRKQNSQKDHQPSSAKRTKSSLSSSSTSSSSANHYFYTNGSGLHRSPSRKNYHQGNGIRISPVLNIPHACISKGTVSLFGLGSLFCNGKSKNKKK